MRRLRLTAMFAVTLVSLVLSGCKSHAESDARLAPRLVQVSQVEPINGVERSYIGVVSARVQSDLGFRISGKVTERLVDTGQVVKRGQRLMRIDATDYTHAITVQTGDVAAAHAHWVQAAADEQRYRGLAESGAIAQLTYDQAKAAADSAKALLSAAEAQEKVARNQGDYSTLAADADGTVVETLAEPGQVVAAGQTMVRLAHAGPREATVDLPETERPTIGSVAHASIYGDTSQASATLRQLSDAANVHTRTFEARYVLEGTGASAPLGATVTLHLSGSDAHATGVQVPLSAIDDEGKGPGIWLIDAKTSQVHFQPVQVSGLGEETAILSAGARVGEKIVAVGGHYLHDAERVQLVDTQVAMQ